TKYQPPPIGTILRIIKHVVDETTSEQDTSEKSSALKESEERTAAILRVALDAIIAIDEHNAITDFNPAAENMFGYTRHEAIGASLPALIIPPHLRDGHNRGLANYLASEIGRA